VGPSAVALVSVSCHVCWLMVQTPIALSIRARASWRSICFSHGTHPLP
jgi:hypothetical protein